MLENNNKSLLVKKFAAKYNILNLDQNIYDSETKTMLENNKLLLLVKTFHVNYVNKNCKQ